MAENEIPEVSMNNTKKEILAAHDKLLKQYKEKQEQSLDAEEKIEEIKTRKAIAAVQGLSSEEVVKEISDVKASIGTLLAQVSDQLELEVERLDSIQRAIGVKEAELNEVFGIEREVGSLAALIEAQRQLKEESDSSLAERRRQLEEEIKKTRGEWEKEKEQRAEEETERKVSVKRQRQREEEEFKYEFEKNRRRAQDQFEEEKQKLEKELRLKREELEGREQSVAAREGELNELRQRVEGFPSELEAVASGAKEETKQRLTAEAKGREELVKQQFEGERNVLVTRIESLEKTINEQAQQLKHLAQTHEKAYQQVQDIALKAVESSGNVRSLSQTILAQSEQRKADKKE
jgi:hypothetical protein